MIQLVQVCTVLYWNHLVCESSDHLLFILNTLYDVYCTVYCNAEEIGIIAISG